MNISTLAKILGVSINELRNTGKKNGIQGFSGRNTRIPYASATEITRILKPEKLEKLNDDDKIYIPATVSVNDLAEAIGKPAGILVKSLLMNGVMATLNEKIDFDTASLIVGELGIEIYPEDNEQFQDDEQNIDLALIKSVDYKDIDEEDAKYITRPPVVTIMGHVDHGKTTLLDTIRKSNIAAGEAGAITQHISSYQIKFKDKKITFIDTPGHAAFTAMRARGSQMADFIILVVSATEGPKPQTVEVIERAKLSKTPIIVAINKIDLPEADPEKVKTDISAFGLVPEEWGGSVPYVFISAKQNQNLDKLLDTILLHSEVAELKGQIECPGQAVVLESYLDQKLGVISTVLVTKGELEVGDILRCSENVGKIRKLENSEGKDISKAIIGEPVILIGMNSVSDVGDAMVVYESKKQAMIDAGQEKIRKSKPKFQYNLKKSSSGEDKVINLILKADVNGSLEALKESIIKIPQDKVSIVIKSEGVGEVTENDIEFARTSDSTILAFHIGVHPKAQKILESNPVNLMSSSIIYELLEWVEEKVLENTEHEIKTTVIGKAKVLAVFKSPRPTQQIFGGEVESGKILSNKEIRIVRDGENLGKFEILDLQREKSSVTEVVQPHQFGISIKGRVGVKKDDIIESVDETVIGKK